MSETFIHPSAVVEKGAELGVNVHIGPLSYVAAGATLGDNVKLIAQATVLEGTQLGAGSQVHPMAVLGGAPQNLKHKGNPTTLIVGRNCIIREGVTLHRGSDSGDGITSIGDDCMFMAYTHIAHDCDLGSNITMSNYSCLAGHVSVGDGVIISGYAAVHQFVRIGHHAFLAGFAAVIGDVIPYGMAVGDRAKLRGLNIIGMKRRGMERSQILEIRKIYRELFVPERTLSENIALVRKNYPDSAVAIDIIDFMGRRERKFFTLPASSRSGDEGNDESGA